MWELALTSYVDGLWVSIFPFFAEPPGYSLGALLESQEILDRLVGAWWFFALFVVNAIFNTILGEEFLFRGVLLPRMEGVFGRWSWVANGVLFGFYHLHQPWGIPGSVISGVFLLRISKLALPQHLDGRYRPLCSKCVLCFPDPWSRIGFGIGVSEIEIEFTIHYLCVFGSDVIRTPIWDLLAHATKHGRSRWSRKRLHGLLDAPENAILAIARTSRPGPQPCIMTWCSAYVIDLLLRPWRRSRPWPRAPP